MGKGYRHIRRLGNRMRLATPRQRGAYAECADRPEPSKKQPWWFTEFDCRETVEQAYFAPVWGLCNVLGVIAHGGGLIYTLTTARLDQTMEVADVKPYVCNPEATALEDVIGVLRVVGLGPGSTFSLGWIVAGFFMLSLCFHLFAAIVLLTHYFGIFPDNILFHAYKYGLYYNIAAWRWVEYFFSASIMLIIMGSSLGVREQRSLQGQVGAMATTILFGWMTDLYSRTKILVEPYDACGRTFLRQWEPWSWITRWQFHLFGYVPYALVWELVFHGYDNAMDGFGQWLPDFVHSIVYGTFSAFTLFGIVQLVLQLLPFGPSLYAWGELVYIALSFAAKAQMGIVVVQQVLIEGAVYDRLLFHKFNPNKTTCADFGF